MKLVDDPLVPVVEPGLCHCECGEKTRIAPKTYALKGWVKGEPRRFMAGHHQRIVRGTLVQQLESKVSFDEDGCWRWTGSVVAGYGMHCHSRAHRVVYETLTGESAGEDLHHLCLEPLCVNPAHLKPMSSVEHRGVHRDSMTHCVKGHPFGGSNLICDKRGFRRCRECLNKYRRQRRLDKKAASHES